MLLFQDGVMLCKATAGMGVPISISPCIGATCPFIIFESADLDSAVDGVIETAFKKKKEVIHMKNILMSSHQTTSCRLFNNPLFLLPLQVHWVLCVQESVLDSVVSRLRLRMAGVKCVGLHSDADRAQVDMDIQEAQQQGATVSQKNAEKHCTVTFKMSDCYLDDAN